MKRYIFSFLIFLLARSVAAQQQTVLNVRSLDANFELAKWLCHYNTVVWWTTESMLASSEAEAVNLKPVWFCFEQQGQWHAAYGSYENGDFKMAFHYTVAGDSTIARLYTGVDSSIANAYSRALLQAERLYKSLRGSSTIQFNRYIRRNEDSSISVWVLPAFSRERGAVYGAELCYRFDRTGIRLVERAEYVQKSFRAFKTGGSREIWLDYKELEQPTVGGLFFVWYYRKYFDEIWIENKRIQTRLRYEAGDGQYYWVHAYR